MADDKSNAGNPDRQRINTSEEYEVRDWAGKFGVTPDQLEQAVLAVGTSAIAVEQYLKRRY